MSTCIVLAVGIPADLIFQLSWDTSRCHFLCLLIHSCRGEWILWILFRGKTRYRKRNLQWHENGRTRLLATPEPEPSVTFAQDQDLSQPPRPAVTSSSQPAPPPPDAGSPLPLAQWTHVARRRIRLCACIPFTNTRRRLLPVQVATVGRRVFKFTIPDASNCPTEGQLHL